MVAQRVQALAEAGLSYLPSQYIQPPELRPDRLRHMEAAVESGSFPVLDLDPSMNPVSHLRHLCSEWGAFHVVNHGVPSRVLNEMKEVGLRFFHLPTEDKLQYACDPGSAATEGYGSRMLSKEEGVLDWRDYFDHHTLPETRRNPSRWPDFPENYRDVVLEYSNNMKFLAQRLLSMISESLNLPHLFIEDTIGEVYQNITISYYSPCPQPELALGLQSHSDMGAITFLIQDDVGGLEILKDGEWVLAKPLSDAIIVILGDQTEILTNGKYKSAIHRAIVNAHRARISIATFYDPAKTRKISPALQLVTEESPLKYREVLYGDYVSSWQMHSMKVP
ncbi:leucoanthocyanidin dioxygenase isoform X2 [Phalaenopsis equestris]|uniref:leucoanthocyanidin dioxygenase isoform X2 n=1 Tax=Phalaenopsis equestris TaxID=78828 RepID=UPI0009E2F893|nr:leucoanthocyanidin dioxygenase isoform X2 [Phalaenopsis equestris]XP_020578773.1 leucoanthocyanidin dioxygenase isoform X2 [Phalaenopsis equestris]XP_020578774.1 leucoanthocyanidin dioxygenase isoform X2 [Phalaenopsis equestris]